jgi:hypothetical protein
VTASPKVGAVFHARSWLSTLGVVTAVTAAGCGQRVTTIGEWEPPEPSLFFEAEAGELIGFRIASDQSASGDAFIVAEATETYDTEPGVARARYVFTLDYAFHVVIWGLIRSPDVGANRFWFRLDDGEWTKWRITVGDIWYWDDFHDDADYGKRLEFELAAGKHDLWIANAAPGAELDRLFVSAGKRPSSSKQTECNPPHSIELQGECHASCGSQNGTACGETACNGKTLLESYDCAVCCQAAP